MNEKAYSVNDELMHYARGQRAQNHKYIAIKNGKYIYPEDNINYNDRLTSGKKRYEYLEGGAQRRQTNSGYGKPSKYGNIYYNLGKDHDKYSTYTVVGKKDSKGNKNNEITFVKDRTKKKRLVTKTTDLGTQSWTGVTGKVTGHYKRVEPGRYDSYEDAVKGEAKRAVKAVKKSAKDAYRVGSNLKTRAAKEVKNATTSASKTYNSASRQVGRTYNDIRDRAEDAYDDVRSGVRSASKSASKTYNHASKQVSRTAKNVSKSASKTYSNLRDRAEDAYDDVRSGARNASKSASKTYNNLRKDVSKTAKNASKAVSGAYKDTTSSLEKSYKSTKKKANKTKKKATKTLRGYASKGKNTIDRIIN